MFRTKSKTKKFFQRKLFERNFRKKISLTKNFVGKKISLKKILSEKSPRQGATQSPRQAPRQGARQSPRQCPRQSPRQGPRQGPRQSPIQSPRQHPRQSPMQSPRQSPRQSQRQSLRQSPRQNDFCKENFVRKKMLLEKKFL